MFENLNFRPHNVTPVLESVNKFYPDKVELLKQFKDNPLLWLPVEEEISNYCKSLNLEYRIEFHHGGFQREGRAAS